MCQPVQLVAETLNTNGISSQNGGAWAYGQSFKRSSDEPISKITVAVYKTGSNISGSLRLLLMSSDSGSPQSIISISTNTFKIAYIDEALVKYLDFHFTPVYLNPNTTYFWVLDGVGIGAGSTAAIVPCGYEAFTSAQDAYTDGKLMFTQAFDGIADTWLDAAPGGEGVGEWMDAYFRVCYDPDAFSESLSVSLSFSSSVSPSATASLSASLSISLSPSVSPSPSRSQYEDKYQKKNTIYTNKYRVWV